MVIPLSGTFDYVMTVPRGGAPWRARQHPDDVAFRRRVCGPGREPDVSEPFPGASPTVEVTGERITLGRAASFELDAGLLACLRPGDTLRVMRTPSCKLGVSILRSRGWLRPCRLVAAVGAVAHLETPPLTVCRLAPEACSAVRRPLRTSDAAPDTAPSSPVGASMGGIEIGFGRETRVLCCGEEVTFGDYGAILLEGPRAGAFDWRDESVAIFSLREPLRDAAVASARHLERGLGRGSA